MNKKLLYVLLGILMLSTITSYFIFYKKTISEDSDSNDPQIKFVESIEKDINLMKKAAEQDNIVAMFLLGNKYLYGDGVKKDLKEGIIWMTKAAEKNDAQAQSSLGFIYLLEDSVKDISTAFKWFKKSAEQGHVVAQLELAKLYANGLGVTKNMETASQWLKKANEYLDPQLSLEQLLIK